MSKLDISDFELMLRIGQALEAKIGQPLIRRDKRSIELTVAGTTLSNQARELIEHTAHVCRTTAR